MPAEAVHDAELQSSGNISAASYSQSPSGVGAQSPTLNARNQAPKTDKPRPHVCGTCARSFARLEHLKRHERSHTKEKPFECPECTRCFARRDLLLRHQQKLHLTQTPSSRPRAGPRRESTSSVASSSGRVRKGSISGPAPTPVSNGDGGASTMRARPRANTIAHIDSNTLGLIASGSAGMAPMGRGTPMNNNGSGGVAVANMGIGGYVNHQDGNNRHNIAKIDTSLSNRDLGGMMPRSAGILPSAVDDLEGFLYGNTINPAALHFNMSPLQAPIRSPSSPFGPPYSGVDSTYYSVDDNEDDFDWLMLGAAMMEPVDQSSPSAFSQTSASGLSEVVIEGPMWQSGAVNATNSAMAFSAADFRTPNYDDTPSSDALSVDPPAMNHQHHFSSHLFANTPTKHSSASSHLSLEDGSRPSLSPAAESVTDSTRTALATTFVQNSGFGVGAHGHQRRASLSAQAMNPIYSKQASINLPLTKDLQRYVDAYIKYFHPHLPFLHLPTLRFDPSGYHGQRGSNGREYLVLSMAAVGALYEFEQQAAGELFDAAKKLVDIFIEETRKSALSAATRNMNGNRPHQAHDQETQLWLVQAMLLNCIFGLQCGDHLACDIARNQISTLVQLARAAGLTRPTSMPTGDSYNHHGDQDIHMADMEISSFGGSLGSDGWSGLGIKVEADEEVAWLNWVNAEERKRTLYGVHYISSLLVAAHNQDPKLGNNEIQLDLPCNENFWMAETAASWISKGGMMAATQSSPSFSLALSGLLSAGQQHYGLHSSFHHYSGGHHGGSGIPPYPPSGIIPSTFGCLVLICALHVYIWETRQSHHGRHLNAEEVQALQAHIEPGLKAWQSAWYLTPHHSIERPNPYGMGPLSADSIPLLDLAYIRLYVDLGRAKEFFWARDFEGMAEELARGWADSTGQSTPPSSASSVSGRSESSFSNAISPASSPASGSPSPNLRPIKLELTPTPQYASLHSMQTTNHLIGAGASPRERYLRQAAFCAADSLAMSDTLSTTKTTTFTACQSLFRELPIQSALCTFDCAQVLAEWIATVQDRVAPFMGVMTLEQCNLDTLEAMMILENEDRKLLGKVRDMLRTAETKMVMEQPRTDYPIVFSSGLGATVLRVSAYMLEQAIVWPATRLMSEALRAQAEHMDLRTRRSVPAQM